MLITSNPNFLSVEIAERVLSAVHSNRLQISVEAHPSSCDSIPISCECFVSFGVLPDNFDCTHLALESTLVSLDFRLLFVMGCPSWLFVYVTHSRFLSVRSPAKQGKFHQFKGYYTMHLKMDRKFESYPPSQTVHQFHTVLICSGFMRCYQNVANASFE